MGINEEMYMQEDRVLTKEEIEGCRHKAEKRWYRRLCVLNVLIVIAMIGILALWAPRKVENFLQEWQEIVTEVEQEEKGITAPKSAEKDLEETTEDETIFTEEEENEILGYIVMFLGIVIILPIVLNFMYQQYRTMSIRITEKNFPEIYERVQLYAKRLGMKKVPEVYIIQQDGILNAFASFIVRKQYIEIYADIFEVAYREHKDLDTISFIIAHEMAHIQYKHATYGYMIKAYFAMMIPIIGATASRAREYSCDRLAQKLTGNSGVEAMFSLVVGKHLYKMVDKEDYLEYAQKVKGFFVWCVNLVADHPVMTKRIQALEMKEGSGKLY